MDPILRLVGELGVAGRALLARVASGTCPPTHAPHAATSVRSPRAGSSASAVTTTSGRRRRALSVTIWSAWEDDLLSAGTAAGVSATALGALLGRSPDQVRARRRTPIGRRPRTALPVSRGRADSHLRHRRQRPRGRGAPTRDRPAAASTKRRERAARARRLGPINYARRSAGAPPGSGSHHRGRRPLCAGRSDGRARRTNCCACTRRSTRPASPSSSVAQIWR